MNGKGEPPEQWSAAAGIDHIFPGIVFGFIGLLRHLAVRAAGEDRPFAVTGATTVHGAIHKSPAGM